MGRSQRHLSRPVRPVRTAGDARADALLRTEGADTPTHGVAPLLSVLPALQEVLARLTTLRSAALTIVLALNGQNVNYDAEVTDTLEKTVCNELDWLIWCLRGIFGTDTDADDEER